MLLVCSPDRVVFSGIDIFVRYTYRYLCFFLSCLGTNTKGFPLIKIETEKASFNEITLK